jgi:HTH-type transcriptional repressor of NAD biosynthesis genes
LEDIEWTTSDFDRVALEQTRRENVAARAGSPVLICDTDAFATFVWERRYLGRASRPLQPWATHLPRRDVYLLTDHIDVPWQDDGLREGDLAIRAAMTTWFEDALTTADHSWVLLTGSLDERVDLAVRTIDQILQSRARFAAPLSGPGFGHAR